MGFGQGDHLGHAIGFDRGVQHQHVVERDQSGHRDQVFVGVKGHLGVQRGVDALDAAGGHKDGVAIGRRARGLSATDVAAGARAVFHGHGLTQSFGQLIGNSA